MKKTGIKISARISRETKMLVEEYVKTFGIKESFLVETALRHYLLALRELPVDLSVPQRIVLSPRSGEQFLERMKCPATPNEDLKALFKDG